MSILTVGAGQQYKTIEAAVAASHSGDTINVQAGTYKNDFVTINHNLTLNAVGGVVNMVATTAPPNGKAIIDEGGSGVTVSITGFDVSGAKSSTGTAAAIRYEGGSLTLNKSNIHDSQQGFYAVGDKNGIIMIENSTFSNNGNGGTTSANITAGAVSQITVENSTITSPYGGSNIVSRAAQTVIEDDIIKDGPTGTGKYAIDLPNGGNATISGDIIEKGPHATGLTAISFGESGSVYGSSSLGVQNSTIVNDAAKAGSVAVVNDSTVTATIDQNKLYNWGSTASGPAFKFLNQHPTTEPALTSQSAGNKYAVAGTSPTSSSGSLFTAPTSPTLAGLPSGSQTAASGSATIPTSSTGSAATLISTASHTGAIQLLHLTH